MLFKESFVTIRYFFNKNYLFGNDFLNKIKKCLYFENEICFIKDMNEFC